MCPHQHQEDEKLTAEEQRRAMEEQEKREREAKEEKRREKEEKWAREDSKMDKEHKFKLLLEEIQDSREGRKMSHSDQIEAARQRFQMLLHKEKMEQKAKLAAMDGNTPQEKYGGLSAEAYKKVLNGLRNPEDIEAFEADPKGFMKKLQYKGPGLFGKGKGTYERRQEPRGRFR